MDTAVDAALDEMPEEFVIRAFLLENRAEVKSMFLTEYNKEKAVGKEREESYRESYWKGYWEGYREGRREGRDERSIEVATALLKEGGLSVAFIARISKLSEDAVLKLAKNIGVEIF